MQFGYARVSSDGQDTSLQVAALERAGVSDVVQETRSGVLHLVQLERLLGRLQPGDQLVVYKVDRLARSLRGLLDVQAKLSASGASLRSLTEPIDTGTPIGRAFFQLLGVFAELERSLIRERCAAGIEAARLRGVRLGRGPLLTLADGERAAALVLSGASAAKVARQFGVSPSTMGRLLRSMGVRRAQGGYCRG